MLGWHFSVHTAENWHIQRSAGILGGRLVSYRSNTTRLRSPDAVHSLEVFRAPMADVSCFSDAKDWKESGLLSEERPQRNVCKPEPGGETPRSRDVARHRTGRNNQHRLAPRVCPAPRISPEQKRPGRANNPNHIQSC